MTSGLEFEGKNIEHAIKKACEKLKIKEEKLKYDVISYGSTGIFGLVGTKKAKIRVTSQRPIKNKRSEKTSDKSEHNPPEMREEPDEIASLVEESFEENTSDVATEEQNENERKIIEKVTEEFVEETANQIEINIDQTAKAGEEVLQKIVDLITIGAVIEIQKENNRIKYQVNGGNSAVLIGKKGQTLEAIQYIVEKIVNKTNHQKILVEVDIEGYLENRRMNLEKLSAKLAEKAKRIGKPVTLGQMNSHDRRVVHLVLKNDTGVRTQSIGNGFYRKLIIFPKRKK